MKLMKNEEVEVDEPANQGPLNKWYACLRKLAVVYDLNE